MSVKCCLPVPVFHSWPKLTDPAARSLCDSWATCFSLWRFRTHVGEKFRLAGYPTVFCYPVSVSAKMLKGTGYRNRIFAVSAWHADGYLATSGSGRISKKESGTSIFRCNSSSFSVNPGYIIHFCSLGIHQSHFRETQSAPRAYKAPIYPPFGWR